MRIRALVLISAITLTFLFAAEKPQDKIAVFVKSGGSLGGLTDPSKDRQDSIKDLLKKLKDSDSLRLVDSESDALAVLIVLDRGTKRTSMIGGMGAYDRMYLNVRLIAGDYSVEFTGESNNGYSAAAGKVVKQLEAWVKDNRDRLLAPKK